MSDKQLQAQRIIEERKRLLAEKVKAQQEQQRLEAERLAADKKKKDLDRWRKLKGLKDKPIKKKVVVEGAPAPLPEVVEAATEEALKDPVTFQIERAESVGSEFNPLDLAYSVDLPKGFTGQAFVVEDPIDELNRLCDSLNSRALASDKASEDSSEQEVEDYEDDFEGLSDSLEDVQPEDNPSLLTESLQFDIEAEIFRIQAFEKARQAETHKYKESVKQQLLHDFDTFGETTPSLAPDSPVLNTKVDFQVKEVESGSSFEAEVNARESPDSSSSSDFERAESPENCLLTQWKGHETACFPTVHEPAQAKETVLLVEDTNQQIESARRRKLKLLAEHRQARRETKDLETPTRRDVKVEEVLEAPTQREVKMEEVKREDLSEKYRRHKKLPQLVYQKPSNRKLIQNAIAKVCCAGAANTPLREEALRLLESRPDALNFIIVFKGNLGRKDLRAIYELEEEGTVRKVLGPSSCAEVLDALDVKWFYRYDSGAREFKLLQCKSFSINTDAVVLV
jgi:hypothetical protein